MKIEYIIPKNKTNIHDFIKKYKNKTFFIKNNKTEFEVKLEKTKAVFIESKLDYYTVNCLTGEFRIDFLNKNKPSFENVYIASISKSDKHPGSQVVKFVIEFLKSFKQVKKAYLIDAATVNCKNSDDRISLSLYKLITSYVGFYQKYGFRLVIDYGKEQDITNNMVRLAKKVSNYKVKDILKNFKEIIKFVEKYKQKIQVKSKYNFNEYKGIGYSIQENRDKIKSDIGELFCLAWMLAYGGEIGFYQFINSYETAVNIQLGYFENVNRYNLYNIELQYFTR
jgi:hypothetical protein